MPSFQPPNLCPALVKSPCNGRETDSVAAYSLASPANGLKTLYYRENDLYCAVRFGELGINQREFHHDAIKDGSVDPFDYEKLFSRLLAMNRWIGTSSGQTFLAGDGTDIYKLEIDVDLRNDCF